ncbi:hypothetical protein TIFTF001_012050 [Ficus carica]|uniref:Uncharacterized protein n=1 Tax=Ficus carica TaxID=3494 RepID=A0AA87ZYB1_FICCA|nr:hypothetical protein TIFTF001_012050 [Ficus carica]
MGVSFRGRVLKRGLRSWSGFGTRGEVGFRNKGRVRVSGVGVKIRDGGQVHVLLLGSGLVLGRGLGLGFKMRVRVGFQNKSRVQVSVWGIGLGFGIEVGRREGGLGSSRISG